MLRHSQFDHSCPLVVINLHVPRMKCMKWTIPMVKSWNCIARGAPQWDTSCASENANRTRRGRGGFPRSKSEKDKREQVLIGKQQKLLVFPDKSKIDHQQYARLTMQDLDAGMIWVSENGLSPKSARLFTPQFHRKLPPPLPLVTILGSMSSEAQ